MKSRCGELGTSFLRLHPAGLLLSAMISGSSCAGQAKQVAQPVPQDTDVASPLAEEFDPRSVREDLLLIEPSFAPPSRRPGIPAAESSAREGTFRTPIRDPGGSGSAARERQGAYQVQVVALRNEAAALQLAESLEGQLGVEVNVIPHNRLHALRAGRFTGPGAAHALKARISEMRSDFADAFVVREDAHVKVETSTASPSPGFERERDLPEPADAGGVRAPGWRVLIDQFLELTAAEEFRRKAVERLDREDVEINFQQPWYKVEVGQFSAGEEAAAQELVALVKRRGFPHALKVRGEVTVPKENQ